ncbi:MAG: TerB family tellurite resistance protein [Fidelibacterota bacterium]
MTKSHHSPEVSLKDYSPLELVTHLFTCIQLADNQMDFEEREVWAEALSALFPEHDYGHATKVFQEATQRILPLNAWERENYAIALCGQLKQVLSPEVIEQSLVPHMVQLVAADGMILSSETNLLDKIAATLEVTIDLSEKD